MDSLSDRIRGVLNGGRPPSQTVSAEPTPGSHVPTRAISSDDDLESILEGQWRESDGGACFVVERRWEPSDRHGHDRMDTIASRLDQSAGAASLFTSNASTRAPFVFFDLETTGLSGGAGTYAFLVGCGSFDSSGAFVVRQFVLTRFSDERALLEMASRELARAGALVSFNGKSFDATVLETRFLFHRLSCLERLELKTGGVPHLDLVHPARQFWKQETCSLVALERDLLEVDRTEDIPGSAIPSQYFHFIRTGDARALVSVLHHNRMDLLTLAALTSRLLHLAEKGTDEARDAREALALGRVYERAGLNERARAAFERAVRLSESTDAPCSAGAVEIASVRALALNLRRSRDYFHAADYWRRLLEIPGSPRHVAHEAVEALAIHHEHRARDLPAAQTFALRNLESVEASPGLRPREAVLHRLERIERKMQRTSQGTPRKNPALTHSRVSATQLLLSWPLPLSSDSPTSGPRTSS